MINIFKLLLPSIFTNWLSPSLDAIFGGGGASADPSYYDPFSDYRGDIAKMYSNYLKPGNATNLYSLPGYTQFQTGIMDPSMDATKRSMAASGQFNSGAEQIALQDVASRGYSNFLNNYMGQLSVASGASQNPATAGAYANQSQQRGSDGLWSAIGAVGSIWNAFSDINMKENIKVVGALNNGLTLYSFEYKPQFKDEAGYGNYVGVMAQEVEQLIPEAVSIQSNGYKAVNYSMIGA